VFPKIGWRALAIDEVEPFLLSLVAASSTVGDGRITVEVVDRLPTLRSPESDNLIMPVAHGSCTGWYEVLCDSPLIEGPFKRMIPCLQLGGRSRVVPVKKQPKSK
jgi:hypothetical protein